MLARTPDIGSFTKNPLRLCLSGGIAWMVVYKAMEGAMSHGLDLLPSKLARWGVFPIKKATTLMVVPTLLYTHFFSFCCVSCTYSPFPSSTLYTGIHSLRGATFFIEDVKPGTVLESTYDGGLLAVSEGELVCFFRDPAGDVRRVSWLQQSSPCGADLLKASGSPRLLFRDKT